MFTATRNFFRRNRKNFAIGVGLAGAGYLVTNYVLSKLSDARERISSDRIARENLRRRFEQNQEDCTFTVQALLPTATQLILEELPVEKLTQELQQKKAARIAKSGAPAGAAIPADAASEASTAITTPGGKDDDAQSVQSFASESYVMAQREGEEKPAKKSRVKLWDEIKISSLSRSFTLLYTLTLLSLLTRVQLNLLGRKNYLSSVVTLSARDGEPTIRLEDHETRGYGTDMATNQQYLTFSWWLLNQGWRRLLQKVDQAVREVSASWTARDTISLGQMKQLILETRKIIEAEGESRPTSIWLPYLLPPRSDEAIVLAESGIAATPEGEDLDIVSSSLRRLLDETSDLIDSPNSSAVMRKMLDAGFDFLLEKLADGAFKQKAMALPAAISAESRITPIHDDDDDGEEKALMEGDSATTKFASVLAVLARQGHLIGNGVPNEYLQVIEQQKELEAFSALVYSSNFEFVAETDDGPASWF
ncbi:Peroxin-3 [Tuber borchii]|uniref:Peroxin-3 n=1 Tax=Tuber borchii TaxID=42251 RepID=A0A2T6ZYN9_TUBBO|nr:Peroxin-3 [Tuber borchii]